MTTSFSIFRLIRGTFAWTSLRIGGPLNVYLFYLIFRHTSAEMRNYSIILLQTCMTDFALILVTALVDENIFMDSAGEMNVWFNGPAYVSDPHLQWVNYVFTHIWAFLDHLLVFGMVAEFFYRYLRINRNTALSLKQYFGLFLAVSIVPPAIFEFFLAAINYPPDNHRYLEHADAARQILGLEPDEPILLSAYNIRNTMLSISLYFLICTSTVAYALIAVLGFLTVRFIRTNLKGATNNQHQVMEAHRQLTKTMVIQALLPAFIYMSLVFNLVNTLLHFNLGSTFMTYYSLFQTVPMYFPAALNPAFTIYVVKAYRNYTWKLIKRTGNILKRLFHCQAEGHSSEAMVVVFNRNFR